MNRVPAVLAVSLMPPDAGWIDMEIRHGTQVFEVSLSDVYDPFHKMLRWLEAVCIGAPLCGFDFHDEHDDFRLLTEPSYGRRMTLIVQCRKHDAEEAAWKWVKRFEVIVARRDVVETFYAAIRSMTKWHAPVAWEPSCPTPGLDSDVTPSDAAREGDAEAEPEDFIGPGNGVFSVYRSPSVDHWLVQRVEPEALRARPRMQAHEDPWQRKDAWMRGALTWHASHGLCEVLRILSPDRSRDKALNGMAAAELLVLMSCRTVHVPASEVDLFRSLDRAWESMAHGARRFGFGERGPIEMSGEETAARALKLPYITNEDAHTPPEVRKAIALWEQCVGRIGRGWDGIAKYQNDLSPRLSLHEQLRALPAGSTLGWPSLRRLSYADFAFHVSTKVRPQYVLTFVSGSEIENAEGQGRYPEGRYWFAWRWPRDLDHPNSML